jgi:hypothetical protein
MPDRQRQAGVLVAANQRNLCVGGVFVWHRTADAQPR